MKKLFGRKQKWINGVLFIRKEDVEQVAKDLIYVNTMLGRNDEDELIELVDAAYYGISNETICVPVVTTEKVWKLLKNSGKMRLVATTEKKAEKPEPKEEMGIVLV